MESLLNLMSKTNKAIIEVYEKEESKADIKHDNTPVTKADLEANRIMSDGLKGFAQKYQL